MTSPIARLLDFGQSPWYDNLARTLLDDGTIASLIANDGVRGVTSNPTILDKAIAAGDDSYMDEFLACCRAGMSVEDTYWQLVVHDIERAADLLAAVHRATRGADGYVSVEVAPTLASDTAATVAQARELFARLGRPNVMVKIPATVEGLPAITQALAAGVNVNVTLIFSLARYSAVIDAFMDGLEQLVASGGDPTRVASVASFFVSRVDTETDRRLPDGHPCRGKAAVANAKRAYRLFRERFSGERWETLAQRGARVQRPLWASTSTKNPDYSPTLYVDELVGRDTVNTLAPASIDALRAGTAHLRADAISEDLDAADQVLVELAAAGVDFDDVTATLEREGIAAFATSFADALATLEKRRDELTR
jgi:transaldolase